MDETKIARIDIERLGHQPTSPLIVRYWYEGWRDGEVADGEEMYNDGGRIESLLFKYEKLGFTCHMMDGNHGRALRGKIVRVDFVKLGDALHIQKYPYGWTANTRPIEDKVVSLAERESAISWCESRGWTVRRWPDGARAFKGPAMPVRDARTIRSMRNRVNTDHSAGRPTDNKRFFDFAYDF
jgi:hypothetical protein